MKKEYYFTDGGIEIFLATPISIHADTKEDAEQFLSEHIRAYGIVCEEWAQGGPVVDDSAAAPVETCPH